ncbi:MAG: hypothetical protein JWO86_2757 [Myxococcaceae bacterium]|nr:hypothetical protein [Myxococcaceae bacterium]
MTEMKRLFDEALSADAARILRSAEGDAPSSAEEKQARIIAAYGSMPSVGAPSAGALDSMRRRRRWAALAGTIVIAGVLAGWQSMPRSAEQHSPPATTTAPLMASPPPPPAAVEQSMRVEDLPAAPEPVASASARHLPTSVGVEDELIAIDMARAALTAGRAEEALGRIADCRKKFPHPRYAEEADALEVQALSTMGRRDEARAKAALFFAAHPDSPYDKRLRAAIGEVQP